MPSASRSYARLLVRPPAKKRSQPREQFREFERLGQVVIASCIEAGNLVGNGVAGREHQHRCPPSVAPQLPAYRKPVASRHHHIENDHVIFVDQRLIHGVFAIRHDINGVGLLAQPLHQSLAKLSVIFRQ